MVRDQSAKGEVHVASIDIGSHTARLLISEKTADDRLFRPLLRKRAYIRLAEDIGPPGMESLTPQGIARALEVLGDFVQALREREVREVYAVSTGVVRKAANREAFLNLVYERTGIKAKVITGEEEARLAGAGVLHSLDIRGKPFILFDLGGGSTEFLVGEDEKGTARSVPLGAMVLTQAFLKRDPPEARGIDELKRHVEEVLRNTFPDQAGAKGDRLIIGTGGTVTTLAAMLDGVDVSEISPEKIHGSIIKRESVEDLFARMRILTVEERAGIKGLDRGRADVILAGSLVVMGLFRFLRCSQVVVSFSDILEGVLIEHLKRPPRRGEE